MNFFLEILSFLWENGSHSEMRISGCDNSSGTTNEASDKITGKVGNGMTQARTHTWAPDISPNLKSLQDLSIRVNPEVNEEVVHHVGL
jgi:hypothetical protein